MGRVTYYVCVFGFFFGQRPEKSWKWVRFFFFFFLDGVLGYGSLVIDGLREVGELQMWIHRSFVFPCRVSAVLVVLV